MEDHHQLRMLPRSLNEVPAKVDVALRVLHYCRSVSDPQSVGLPTHQKVHMGHGAGAGRALTQLEKGAENAALNLIRNYLTGEIQLGPLVDLHQVVELGQDRGEDADACQSNGEGETRDDAGSQGEAA